MFLELVRETAGDYKNSSTHERYCCPFCMETKYKFYVEVDDPYRWICFKCGLKGNPITYVREFYGMNYQEAKDVLVTYDYDIDNLDVSRFNSQYADDSLTESEQILLAINGLKKTTIDINLEDVVDDYQFPTLPTGVKFFANIIGSGNELEALPFIEYLQSRGVTSEEVITHGMGYVTYGEVTMPNGTSLTLQDHVIFLTYDNLGNPMYWNTRAIHKESYIKSFNAPSREHEYGKHNSVFNLNRAKTTGKVIINEGVFDALTCGNSGVATFGKQITDSQVRLLLSAMRHDKDIAYYIFLDRDAYDKGLTLAEKLYKHTNNVYLVLNTTESDANDLGRDYVSTLIDNALPFTPANSIKYLMYKEG